MGLIERAASSVSAVSQHKIQLYIQYSSIVIVWYDYLLTLAGEAKVIWSRPGKSKITTLLYIPLRYPLIGNVLYLFAVTNKLDNCNVWYKFIGALSVVGRACLLAIITLRTTAVYDNNIFVGVGLGLLGLTIVALDLTHVPGLRCSGSVSIQIASTLLSIFVCIFEASAATLIFIHTIRRFQASISQPSSGIKRVKDFALNFNGSTLMECVLRQGLLYFCFVFAFQFTAVMLNFFAGSGNFSRLINSLTLPVSCLLTARFIINLQEWKAQNTVPEAHVSEIQSGGSFRFVTAVQTAIMDEFSDVGTRVAIDETPCDEEKAGEAPKGNTNNDIAKLRMGGGESEYELGGCSGISDSASTGDDVERQERMRLDAA